MALQGTIDGTDCIPGMVSSCGVAELTCLEDSVTGARSVAYRRRGSPVPEGMRPCTAKPAEPAKPAAQEAEALPTVEANATGFGELVITPPTGMRAPGFDYVPVRIPITYWAKGDEVQTHTQTILGHEVTITARAESYEWDLGDGNTLTTTFPGGAPTKKGPGAIFHYYRFQGWYQVTIRTTYSGSYSIDGGEEIPIDGTVTLGSEPGWFYSKSLRARLTGENYEAKPIEVPPRTAENLGRKDPAAEHRDLTEAMNDRAEKKRLDRIRERGARRR